ncbi:MAG TPA: sigma 54-interacting transcriptional regulator [Polyangiaceae bacterium]|nr:sigma 54-interacting transcriptional regulator [Polyangiaceae bacterium]
MSPVDQTLDEVALASAGSSARAPVLFIVLEADRPTARGARFSLVGVDSVTLGRGEARAAMRSGDGRSLDVRLPGKWLSTQHARVRAVGGDFIVEDAGSRNGTFVNGRRVSSHVLRDGDVVETGRVYFAVRGAPAADGPLVRDEDASRSSHPFGFRTLLPELEQSFSALGRVARKSSVPVLFLGPTGSGKEVLAREVHAQSGRTGGFIPVNCGALPTSLVEGLLFGHVKGAFSGASRDEVGFVRSADGGTLFLDEIGDLPAASQAALLRVLQEGEVIAIGATRAVKVDVRVVAATHRPLEVLSGSGGFRTDLLARLKGYSHRLPALGERMADFGVVLADVLAHAAGERATRLSFTPEAARALLAYPWPLNIRELHQAMASAVALAAGDVIEPAHLPAELFAPPAPPSTPTPSAPAAEQVLRDRIIALLHEHRGNVTAVARAFGKAPAQVHRWMHRLQIDPDTYRPGTG